MSPAHIPRQPVFMDITKVVQQERTVTHLDGLAVKLAHGQERDVLLQRHHGERLDIGWRHRQQITPLILTKIMRGQVRIIWQDRIVERHNRRPMTAPYQPPRRPDHHLTHHGSP